MNSNRLLQLCFLSVSQDRKGVCNLFDSRGLSVFGTTTNGEFINDELEKNSTAIISLDIRPEYFTILLEEFQNRNFSEASESIPKKALEKFQKLVFLIAAVILKTDAEELISGFKNILGKEVYIFGGMAGDDYTFTDQFVFKL
jgi:hypothetical protein